MADGSVIIDTELNNSGVEKDSSKLKSILSKVGSVASTAMKGVGVAVGTATTAVAGLVTASVNAYAEYEQLVGGVDTLFKNSSEKLQEYADEAYKTAGMSANEYMNTVTSFSASLLQSLGNDTEKATEYANQAVIDMSDNANKMGTSMESIQYAYQGFAKQNYTMLDNLKLGYGGTKEEMERLLEDASKLSGIEFDISSFADVTQAIHVIQENMGIAGTTAKEASTTIQGSLNSIKGAWENLLVGMTNPNADFDTLIQNLVDSIATAGENLLPAIEQALIGVSELIDSLFPLIAKKIPDLIVQVLPQLISAGTGIVTSLVTGIQQNLPALVQGAIQIVTQLLTTLLSLLPQLLDMGVQILMQLVIGIGQALPELIPQAVNAVTTIVENLIDNIDLIIEAGMQLLIGLAEGLINAIPQLIEKIPIIIDKLLNAIIENLPKLVEMGVELVVKLAVGLVQAIPTLVGKIPQLISSVLNAIGKLPGMVIDIGKNIVQGIWNGISGAASWLWNKITGWCSSIFDGIKSFFGIHSPSKLFADDVGKMLGLGIGEGFDDSLSSVYKEMQDAVEDENAKLTSNLTSNQQIKVQSEDNRQATLKSIDDNKEIVVNSTTKLDSKVIARETNKVNERQ